MKCKEAKYFFCIGFVVSIFISDEIDCILIFRANLLQNLAMCWLLFERRKKESMQHDDVQ